MAWLKTVPKQPSSMKQCLVELKKAVAKLMTKRQAVMDNEVSLEYPREGRVKMYEMQISTLDRVLNLMNEAIAELSSYPK